ncbi:YbaB/EbfC family nucleoid-associated protein [Nocardia terpenica]|uniref:YbaB/EbfC family DNA-binding protein n=1 Tax=Nocardia terpenica TaxID=455432 RepID=A0A6G9YX62_9NOCA|nr:YbaB/EbfC family nucleoid-associated protein [Nocardia terpenica]QIS17804.1 YbaB/EbfC family DNA-binding protein [Nocardia terpenica]
MVESMDELEARVRGQLYRIRDLGDQMAAIRVREVSADGAVTAEVDGNGALTGLEFTAAVARLSPADFERRLVDTAAAAAAAAFEQRARLITEFTEELSGNPG